MRYYNKLLYANRRSPKLRRINVCMRTHALILLPPYFIVKHKRWIILSIMGKRVVYISVSGQQYLLDEDGNAIFITDFPLDKPLDKNDSDDCVDEEEEDVLNVQETSQQCILQ